MKFLKLTGANNGKPLWINLDRMDYVEPDRDSRTCIGRSEESGPSFIVQETPEQILAMLDGKQTKGEK